MTDRTVMVRLVASTSAYQAKMAQAGVATRKFGSEAANMAAKHRQGMNTLGLAAVGFGAAVVGGLGVATKSAIDFESSFAGVRKTVDATEPQFQKLARGLRDLATEIPVNVNELNKMAEAAGQLGIKREAIIGFTDVVAKLGVATNLAGDEAATSLARIANIMQTPQDEFDRMGSTIVALGNNLATTEAELVQFGLRLSGAGKIAGLAESDVLAIGGAMSSVGVQAEAGGTAVQKVLLTITEQVNTGGKKLDEFAKAAGMSANEFAEMWRADPAEAFTLFVEGLGNSGQDAMKILADLGLTDQRLIRSFLSLAGAGDVLRDSIDLGSQSWEENNALNKEAAQRFATTESQMQLARNKVNDLAISIGEITKSFLDFGLAIGTLGLGEVADFFNGMPGPLKVAGVAMVALAGGVSLVGGALLLTLPRIQETRAALASMPAVAGAARASVSLFAMAIKGLGVSLLAFEGFQLAKQRVEEFKEELGDEGWWAAVEGHIDRISLLPDEGVQFVSKEELERIKQLPEGVEKIGRSFDVVGTESERLQGIAGHFEDIEEASYSTANQIEDTGKKIRAFAGMTKKEFNEWRLETRGAINSVDDVLERFAGKTEVSADRILRAFDKQLSHMRDYEDNWRKLLRRGLPDSLTKQLQEMGIEGAGIVDALANANDKDFEQIIRKWLRAEGVSKQVADAIINDMKRSKDKSKDYRDELDKIPPRKHTDVTADTSRARSAVDALLDKYRGMHVAVIVEGRIQGTGTVRHSGGWIPGAGEVPITAMAGEYIVRKDRSSKYADVLQAINTGSEDDIWHRIAGKMHNGGRVEPRIILELAQLNQALHKAATTPTLGGNLVQVANSLIGMGFRASGHPAFPPIGGHSPNSWHYKGRAVDFNYGPGGASAIERAAIARVLPALERLPHLELLHPFNDPDHDDHLHYAMRNGAYFNKDRTGMATIHRGEVVSPVPVMRQVVREESGRSEPVVVEVRPRRGAPDFTDFIEVSVNGAITRRVRKAERLNG